VITPAAYPPRPAPGGAPIPPLARSGPAGAVRSGAVRSGAVRSGAVGRQRSSTAAAHSSALVQAERFGPAPARPGRWGLGAALGRSRRWR